MVDMMRLTKDRLVDAAATTPQLDISQDVGDDEKVSCDGCRQVKGKCFLCKLEADEIPSPSK